MSPTARAFILVLSLITATWSTASPATEPPAPALVALDLTDLADGRYVLEKRQGGATLRPLLLIQPSPSPQPLPDPSPSPTPTLTDRAKTIRDKASAVVGDQDRDGSALALSTLYGELARQSRTGQIKDAATLQAVAKGTVDMILASRGKGAAEAWAPVRAVLADQLAALAQRGATLPDYAALFEEAAAGLAASTDRKAISPEMLALIMEIIKIVLALLIK